MLIPIKGDLPPEYMEARGLGIFDFRGRRYLWFKYPCKYLTETGACSIEDHKPVMCRSQAAGCDECLACRELLKTEKLGD